jgi:hypothetical protein
MGKYTLVVTSHARPGQDDEYNRWYDEEHLGDVCNVPGIVAGRRFVAHSASPTPAPAPYLAIYEIEADDPTAVLAELGRRARAGEMNISPSLEPGASMMLYENR